ncbi:membrane protein [Ralstonia sp. AU12-08]|nr:membrane protein [Ralstonia sp. AU12-08]
MTTAMIKTLALIVYLLVLLIHVYIVVLEMVLWKTRGPKVFRITPEKAAETAAMASNQGLYNGFLVAALVIGLVAPNPVVNASFALFGLICVAVAGIWGAITVSKRILYVQTVPAVAALVLGWFA